MTDPLDDLVDGWETMLLAAWYPDNEIKSILRLNKLLAALQRLGVPIPIRFNNIEKGPASLDVEPRTRVAAQENYLDYTTTPMGEDKEERHEWKLTPQGQRYVHDEIMERLKDHPKGKMYLETFHAGMRQIGYVPNKELVAKSHEILHLDEEDTRFVERYNQTRETLEGWLHHFEEDNLRTETQLVAGAATELGIEALMAFEDDLLGNSTGRNNILWNCEQLLGALADLGSSARMEGPDEGEVTQSLERILNALEVNCMIYDYVDIPSQDDIDDFFWSAEPSDPEDLIA